MNSAVEISVDCSNLTKGNPLLFYVNTPTVNSYNEFRYSTNDGKYSGIQSIDGTDSRCNINALADKFALSCSNLETVKFNNNLTTIGQSSFSGCSALKTVSMPGVRTIGQSSFSGCSALTSFNIDNNGYSVIPSNAIVNKTAFSGVAIEKLSLSSTE